MPRTSGNTSYNRRRVSGGATTVAPTGKLLASAALAGTGGVKQSGTGALVAHALLSGTGTTGKAGTGSLVAHGVLTGTGAVKQAGTGAMSAHGVLTGTGSVSQHGTGSLVATATLTGTGTHSGGPSGPWTNSVTFVHSNAATVAITTHALGDYICVASFISSGTGTITVSGGGVSTWAYFGATTAMTESTGFSFRLAYGKVTTVGAETITVTPSAGSVGQIVAAEFTPPTGTSSVAVDGTQGVAHGTTSPMTGTSKVPSGSSDLAWYMMVPVASATAGSSTGFVYYLDTNTNTVVCYSLAAPNPSSPTAPCTGSGAWDAIGGLLVPS